MKLKNKLKNISKSWYFLIIVIIIYFSFLIFKENIFYSSLSFAYNIFLKIIPVFILIFVLMALTNYFVTPEFVIKHFKKRGIKKWFFAIIGGVLSTGPIYMWYPLLKDLKEKGMEDSFITTFLYNRAVKIPLLPMMIYCFGLAFTLVLTFYMILFSIINGVLVDKILKFKNSTKIIRNSL